METIMQNIEIDLALTSLMATLGIWMLGWIGIGLYKLWEQIGE